MSGSSQPVAMVPRFVGRRHRLRKARGFSLGELRQAGLQRSQARSIRLRTDERRSTVHAHNVAALKAFAASLTPTTTEEQPPAKPSMQLPEQKRRSSLGEKKPKPRRPKRVPKRES
ncbi:ribosomal protein L13e [[Eubacterium] cellulosolvens]